MFNLEGGGAERKEGHVRRYSIRHKPKQQQANNFGQTLPSLSMLTEIWMQTLRRYQCSDTWRARKKKFPLNVSPTGGRDMFRVSYVSCTPRSQTYKVTNPFPPLFPRDSRSLFPFFHRKTEPGRGSGGRGRKRTDGIIFHLAPGFYANSLDGCAALASSMFLLFFIPNKKRGRGKCRLGRKKQQLCQFVAAAAACCGSRSIRFLLFLSCSFFFTVASSSSPFFAPRFRRLLTHTSSFT